MGQPLGSTDLGQPLNIVAELRGPYSLGMRMGINFFL